MKKMFASCIAASLVLTACSSPSASLGPNASTSTATIKGQLILPYRLQAPTKVAHANFNLLTYFTGQAAMAQTASDAAAPSTGATATGTNAASAGQSAGTNAASSDQTASQTTSTTTQTTQTTDDSVDAAPSTATTTTTSTSTSSSSSSSSSSSTSTSTSSSSSDPLTTEEVEDLTAEVDDEPVDIEITNVTTNGDETVIDYEIEDAPAGEGNEVVEVTTPDGNVVGCAIVDAEPGETVDEDITPETTAVVNTAVKKHGSMKIRDLTAAELTALGLDPAVLQMAASVRSILRKDGTLKPNVEHHFKKSKGPKSASSEPSTSAPGNQGKSDDAPKGKPEDKPENNGKNADKVDKAKKN